MTSPSSRTTTSSNFRGDSDAPARSRIPRELINDPELYFRITYTNHRDTYVGW